MTITSNTNQHLKEIRKLGSASARAKTGRFVAEGEDLWRLTPPGLNRSTCCARRSRRGAAEGLPRDVARAAPRGLAARLRARAPRRLRAALERRHRPLAVALWGVGDPRNVGTISAPRTPSARRRRARPGCADPLGPKAVRASMGAIFATPLARFSGSPSCRAGDRARARRRRPLRGPLEGGDAAGRRRTRGPARRGARAGDEVRSIRRPRATR